MIYSDLGEKFLVSRTRTESKMTVAQVMPFFSPSVNKSFIQTWEKFLVSRTHTQRVKNDHGVSMSLFFFPSVNKSFIQTWETKIFGFMHTHTKSQK
jgi:hypothetical protein